jgi:hypothetical protein
MQHTDYDDTEGLLDELRTRLEDAKSELDRQVSEHPFAAVGLALVFGAVLALGPRKRVDEDTKRTIGHAVTAALTALAIRGAKAYAWSQLKDAARGLFETSARERTASRDPSVEAFLEH